VQTGGQTSFRLAARSSDWPGVQTGSQEFRLAARSSDWQPDVQTGSQVFRLAARCSDWQQEVQTSSHTISLTVNFSDRQSNVQHADVQTSSQTLFRVQTGSQVFRLAASRSDFLARSRTFVPSLPMEKSVEGIY
jgi:hypothetical protein